MLLFSGRSNMHSHFGPYERAFEAMFFSNKLTLVYLLTRYLSDIYYSFIFLEVRQANTLLDSELHYLAYQCTVQMHSRIARNFIALYTDYLGTVGGCDGDVECTIENVEVDCGAQSGILRRRDIADGEQPSKVPITVKFAVKVPLPSNASVADLNQTTQRISSNILASLNETDLTLNVSGVVLEYDSTRPPVVRILGLVCDKGQVLKGTKCGKT